MEHKEDEQPNEAVHGRRKRILPFVRDTSRIQGQKKHQSHPTIFSASSQPSRGRGHGRGHGQGKHRGRGGGSLPRPPPELPRYIEGSPWSQLDDFGEYGPEPVAPEPATPPDSSFGAQPSPSSGHPLLKKLSFKETEKTPEKRTSDLNIPGPQPSIRPPQNSERPRKRFRPGKNGKHRLNSQHNRANANAFFAEPLAEQQSSQKMTDFASDIDHLPAKRPRITEEAASSSCASMSLVNQEMVVKSEIEDESATKLLREDPTSGSKFISYDSHPMCRFECGEPPSRVRKHRKALKQQQVRVLRDQGMNVLATFIRDDGIAIDWSIPMKNKDDISTSKSMSPIVVFDDPKPNFPSPGDATPPISSPRRRPLPSHINPLAVSADKHVNGHPSIPTVTEIACREIPIPLRHLPRDGNTRKLEIWALEQMRLLEAELGPIILPPPELVGIGEYLIGQRLSEGVCPHIKIRYERTVRVKPRIESSTNPDEAYSLADLMQDPPAISSEYPSPIPPSPNGLPQSTLPPIAHMEAPHLSPPTRPLPVKDEVDELANNPPSPLASFDPAYPIPDMIPTFVSNTETLKENESCEPQIATNEESSQNTPTDLCEELDELQRLRRDLELSRFEAERKHKELEERILELSRKRPESHTPRSNEQQPPTTIRIANEGKSTILPLRRGKYDKTRRLLAVSNSTILHVSWLGVMQLVNKSSRRIVATGFRSGPPSSISIEDACSLSPSSTALALSGHESQLAVTILGEGSFDFHPLQAKPHDTKGICSVVPIDQQSVITLGHDHRYMHWNFQPDRCSTNPLPLPKLHTCTALAFDPLRGNIITAGSDSNKRSKLTLHNLVDSKHIPNTVELSNHPHHINIDCDNPFLLVLEVVYPLLARDTKTVFTDVVCQLARLDDQFQVHDIRMPLYQCVQKFGYQSVVHEKAEFRVRGSSKGNYFSRGDTGIVRLWDRRSPQSYQTVPAIPLQRIVEVVLDHSLVSCATETHHIVTYPIL
ncbi:unnamed protein product [Rhizoctonia solani]|uniref:Uncharacterized protein n=1 Tax=Rhizoctonia solani TaxID=456999 RepID=A0A8H2XBL2_9AGAM|nr:unnamed protein product [Rhizoctonia solani]